MSDASSWVKPIIILVPGAWNTPCSFNLLTPFLETAGYIIRSISLPSVGADPPIDDIQPDVDAIKAVILQEVNAANDVLLLMHDYASVPGGEAVKGLDKKTRLHNGLSGGVTCLFYAASPLLSRGSCLADSFSDIDHSWIIVSKDKRVAVPARPVEVFCPEVEPELAREYTDSLRPHSYQTFFSRTTWEPYKDVPFFCLFCKLDKMVSLEKQKTSAAAADIRFKSSTLTAGHCPFLALPEQVANAIRRAAKESTYYNGVVARDYGLPDTSQSLSRKAPD